MTRRTAYLAIAIPAQVLQVAVALIAVHVGLGDRDAILAICFIASCAVTVLGVLAVDAFGTFRTTRRHSKHPHDYQRVGYGGAGWSVYRCACGAQEIDA